MDGSAYRSPLQETWSDVHNERLKTFLADGYSFSQVSRRMHWSCGYLRERARELGVEVRRGARSHWTKADLQKLRELYEMDVSWNQIARTMERGLDGCQVAVRKYWPDLAPRQQGGSRDHKSWAEQDLLRLHALRGEGKNWDEISAAIGHPADSCVRKWKHGDQAFDMLPKVVEPLPPQRPCIGRLCCWKPRDKRMFQPKHRWNFLCSNCDAAVGWMR